MGYVKSNFMFPFRRNHSTYNQAQSSAAIDDNPTKIAFVGSVYNKDHAQKDITKVHVLFGTVVKAGGSGLTLSLQDLALGTGSVTAYPDGTPDQTAAIANAASTFVSSGLHVATLSAPRTVNYGELLAVVIEWDGAGRLGSDSFSIRTTGHSNFTPVASVSYMVTYAGSWSVQSSYNVPIILEFSDGTFGSLEGGSNYPLSADASLVTFNVDSSPDERAIKITMPYNCKTNGFYIVIGPGSAGVIDVDIVLYASDGTTVLGTHTIDFTKMRATNNSYEYQGYWPSEIDLTKGAVYYLAFKPTVNTATVRWSNLNYSNANHRMAFPDGEHYHFAHRVNGGSWTDVTTTLPADLSLNISQIHDGEGVGGSSGVIGS